MNAFIESPSFNEQQMFVADLYERLRDKFYHQAKNYSHFFAQDIVSQAFENLLKNSTAITNLMKGGNPEGYLYRTVYNAGMDCIRAEKRYVLDVPEDKETNPYSAIDEVIDMPIIEAEYKAQMTPEQWEIIALKMDDYCNEVIAEVLNITSSGVRKRSGRAKKKIKDWLKTRKN